MTFVVSAVRWHRGRGARCPPAGRFYSGSLLVAFEYLHAKFVAYRDLKPENVMLGLDGYIKLIDFGHAKVPATTEFALSIVR